MTTSKNTGKICPLGGGTKPRRYAVSRSVWEKATQREKDSWKENARPGSLRRMAFRPVRGK